MITQRTRLNMRPGGVMPVVHVSQYDNDAAALIFDLYDDGAAFTIPGGYSVLLNGLKPDNYGFSYQAASYSGNTVVCNLTTQMTAVAGATICELRVKNGAGTQIIGTANFILAVEQAALTDDTIISDTMIPLIEQAVEIASNLDRYITQTQENAEAAQTAATTATNAANSAQIVDANVTGLYSSIEEAKTNANTAAANANATAAAISAAAARGDYKGDKGDKGDSGITAPVWGMYTMYVDESTGDLWLVTNGEYGSEYWFKYDSETGLLYYCTPDYVEKTVSGELIEITDAANLGALQCKVAFSPIQSGTGDPSPTNIRSISGRTGLTVTVQSGETQNTYPVTWQTEAGTIYGGTLDVVSGVLTVDRFFKAFDGTETGWTKAGGTSNNTQRYYITWENIGVSGGVLNPSDAVCSHLVYLTGNSGQFGAFNATVSYFTVKDGDGSHFADLASFTAWLAAQNTNGTPLQLCVELAESTTYQLTPTEVRTILGDNNVWSDGDTIEAFTYVSETYDEEG